MSDIERELEAFKAMHQAYREAISHAVWSERYARQRQTPAFEGQSTFSKEALDAKIAAVDNLLLPTPTTKMIRSSTECTHRDDGRGDLLIKCPDCQAWITRKEIA